MVLESSTAKESMAPMLTTWLVKWLSGFIFSFVFSSIGLAVFEYGTFSFIFVLVAAQIFFWKVFHKSGIISVLLFDAIFVFLLLAVKLYIVLGPNL